MTPYQRLVLRLLLYVVGKIANGKEGQLLLREGEGMLRLDNSEKPESEKKSDGGAEG